MFQWVQIPGFHCFWFRECYEICLRENIFHCLIDLDTHLYSLEHGSWVTLTSKKRLFWRDVESEKSKFSVAVSEAPVPISTYTEKNRNVFHSLLISDFSTTWSFNLQELIIIRLLFNNFYRVLHCSCRIFLEVQDQQKPSKIRLKCINICKQLYFYM